MLKWWRKKAKSEDGSATIEFLGIVPLALMLLMIIVQFVVGVNAVLVTQSAANEYATVYSVTENPAEAATAAREILSSTGNYLQASSISGSNLGSKEFSASVSVNIHLIFLPEEILGYSLPSVPYTTEAYGRVIE
ncbi:TadE/TadG family type IV pilus assembly protein [Virgibacillus siamensis]|uniref:TadE/TadG family type IV pilus assembly protein n=1 Tax=Virgibacillus siamensis TaxID=480071 RepID=UPI0011159C3F|nr:TadE family protein [Virgibacillus siamensis]